MNIGIKVIIWVCRILVGGLFIFSGLVKANDAIGFSYKLEEYFVEFAKIFNDNGFGLLAYPMEWLEPLSLPLAMFIVVLEIVLGILTLTGTKMKQVASWLLALILFFTFLTYASSEWEIVRSCGCFGDFIPLDPFESFLKDLILLGLIIPIFLARKHIESFLTPIGDRLTIYSSFIVFFLFTFYAYNHLPFADHRAYAVGNRLLEQMETKPGNPLILYKLQHKTNGAVAEMANYPDDYQNWEPYVDPNDSAAPYFRNVEEELTVKHIKVKSTGQQNIVTVIPNELTNDWELIKEETNNYFPEIDPKIVDLRAEDIADGFVNKIDEMLADSNYRIVLVVRSLDFFGDFTMANDGWHFNKNAEGEKYYKKYQNLYYDFSKTHKVFTTILTSENDINRIDAFKQEMETRVKFYYCDDKELKTMIRASPGLFLWKKDLVMGKWHYYDFPTFEELNDDILN